MTDDGGKASRTNTLGPGTLKRGRSTFTTKAAQDDAAQLSRRFSASMAAAPEAVSQSLQSDVDQPQQSIADHETRSFKESIPRWFDKVVGLMISANGKDESQDSLGRSRSGWQDEQEESVSANKKRAEKSKAGSGPRTVGGTDKLGTTAGVFVPTTLNVLSILMFLRFGFILGQGGLLGMLGLLIISYLINLVTTLSISAIASNGTVRGGGAYYLISRSLGAEFGGSIGLVFYLGFIFNTSMNAIGLVDCLFENFGASSGDWYNFLPQNLGYQYLWATCVLVTCTLVCLAGSSLFARCSNALLFVLLIATFSIPLSTVVLSPFSDTRKHVEFTGLSLQTLKENLMPHFTRHAAGSQIRGRENYPDLFGILFPATGGIFAGASMSGDLQNPSRSIPRGTLASLGVTFFVYALVIVSMAASITRASLYSNVNVIQDTNVSEVLVFLGEIATCFFSVLMGVIGPAKLLQAIARDSLLPGLGIFAQGTKTKDEPTFAIVLTFLISQVSALFDLNRLASFITMAYLMTFLATNLACFLLTISSAPNFRPSFRYFNRWTAAAGTLVSGASMFFVDGLYAAGCICVLLVLFALIHFTATPKSWGDVSQALIYHQVRKFLLKLRTEHVKFWRPQILLFVNNPSRSYGLIQFCNSLKKGGLFILGHVIVTSDFGSAVPEARRQQSAWTKFIELSRIKSFVNIAISPAIEWGARNIVLSAGLGGMRPNIVMMGFYNMAAYRMSQSVPELAKDTPEGWNLETIDQRQGLRNRKKKKSTNAETEALLSETFRSEGLQDIQSYVTVLEDLLLQVRINVAVARGFDNLELPNPMGRNNKRYIDLWPIQMSAEVADAGDQNIFTNFDTITLILQLGCILTTVSSYRHAYKLRVNVFVEYENEVEPERKRVTALLETLRIQAEVQVFWLASGDVKSYQVIVNGSKDIGDSSAVDKVEATLQDEEWWRDVKEFRGAISDPRRVPGEGLSQAENILNNAPSWPESSFQQGRKIEGPRFDELRKLVTRAKRRRSISSLGSMGVSLGMRTHHLNDDLLDLHASASEASSDTESDQFFDEADDEPLLTSEDEERDFESSQSMPLLEHSLAKQGSKEGSSKRRPLNRIAALQSATSSNVTGPSIHSGSSDSPQSHEAGVAIDDDFINLEEDWSHDYSRDETIAGYSTRQSPRAQASRASENADGLAGPSVVFVDTPPPRRTVSDGTYSRQPNSAYQRKASLPLLRASGFPSAAALPLSFNELPCRAQHLILNELMVQHSSKYTAVMFTTLPAPVEGTHKKESDCLSYLSDLEVLTENLPPTLLVHSNSMTVTTNL